MFCFPGIYYLTFFFSVFLSYSLQAWPWNLSGMTGSARSGESVQLLLDRRRKKLNIHALHSVQGILNIMVKYHMSLILETILHTYNLWTDNVFNWYLKKPWSKCNAYLLSTSICFSPTKIARFRRCGRCLSHAVNFKAMLGPNRKEKLKKRKKSRDKSQENRTLKKVRKFVWTSVFIGLGFWVRKFWAKNTFRYLLLTKYLIMIIAYTYSLRKGIRASKLESWW